MFSVRQSVIIVIVSLLVAVAVGQDSEWRYGRGTFYGNEPWYWSIHYGSCGYGYICPEEGTGWDVAALSDLHQEYSGSCGRCYEVKCNPTFFRDGYGQTLDRTNVCHDIDASVLVTIVDTCPCNYATNAYSNRRWCCGDMDHFDLSVWSFEKLAEIKWGVIGLVYRPVPCNYRPYKVAAELDEPHWGEEPEAYGQSCPKYNFPVYNHDEPLPPSPSPVFINLDASAEPTPLQLNIPASDATVSVSSSASTSAQASASASAQASASASAQASASASAQATVTAFAGPDTYDTTSLMEDVLTDQDIAQQPQIDALNALNVASELTLERQNSDTVSRDSASLLSEAISQNPETQVGTPSTEQEPVIDINTNTDTDQEEVVDATQTTQIEESVSQAQQAALQEENKAEEDTSQIDLGTIQQEVTKEDGSVEVVQEEGVDDSKKTTVYSDSGESNFELSNWNAEVWEMPHVGLNDQVGICGKVYSGGAISLKGPPGSFNGHMIVEFWTRTEGGLANAAINIQGGNRGCTPLMFQQLEPAEVQDGFTRYEVMLQQFVEGIHVVDDEFLENNYNPFQGCNDMTVDQIERVSFHNYENHEQFFCIDEVALHSDVPTDG